MLVVSQDGYGIYEAKNIKRCLADRYMFRSISVQIDAGSLVVGDYKTSEEAERVFAGILEEIRKQATSSGRTVFIDIHEIEKEVLGDTRK